MASVLHFITETSSSSTCGRFIMSQALQNHRGLRFNSSFVNTGKLDRFPQICRIPCARRGNHPKVVESKICSLRSYVDAPCLFPSPIMKPHFGCWLSHKPMLMNMSSYGLRSGRHSVCCGSITRSFSQVPRAARSSIVKTEDVGSGKNNYFKRFNKNGKLPKASTAQKGSSTSVEETNIVTSQGKKAASEDISFSTSKDQNIEDVQNLVITTTKQTPKAKDKTKAQSQSKKKEGQASSAIAPDDARDAPVNKSPSKNNRSKTSKPSPASAEYHQ